MPGPEDDANAAHASDFFPIIIYDKDTCILGAQLPGPPTGIPAPFGPPPLKVSNSNHFWTGYTKSVFKGDFQKKSMGGRKGIGSGLPWIEDHYG